MKRFGRTMVSAMVVAAMLSGCGSTAATSTETSSSAVGTEAASTESASTAASEAASEAASTEAAVEKSSVRTTAYGDVEGALQDGVEVYYGIPYGKEPVGDLRWKAPEKPDSWEETKDVSEKEDMAIQLATVDGESQVTGTTDCLNLDVYTTPDAEKKPVIVYIHGGNNQTGNAQEIPGTDIVKNDDAVYVSVNYRLGYQGFNCLPALIDDENNTGNFAMLDLAASLQWVRDNIANFGGDPENVTVSGFSAGGRDVMAMLISPTFEGLFDKAIAYSGGMTVSDVEESQRKIAEKMAPLAVEDGKAEDEESAAEWLLQDTDEVKEYLYSITDERLTSISLGAGIRMSGFPHLYADDVVIPSKGFSAEYVNDVPVLMLTGSSEFTFFGCTDSYFDSLEDDEKGAAIEFTDKYGSDFYRIFNTQLSAEKMDPNYNSDIYIAQINYGGRDSASKIDLFGSFHGIFVPMLSNTHGYSGIYDFESQDGYQDMAQKFNAYLKNFINTGDPNGEGTDTEWKTWTSDEKNTMVFDADETAGSTELKDVFKTNAEIISEIDADDSVSDEVKTYIVQNIMNGRWFSADMDEHFNTPSLW
ncbi:carboxylesterase family protein [Lachnospiraceae bacterium C1.1]|nr:carboxylesterase family protein [Lachnospiraceae bacterium C1.1]